ncbi:palmitoyltransferase ZDHHC23 isoform X1 [Periplaneta americana]|uniref:palmitoyltransferase ZDHHC23 isoform X1 n=2 Tax=Periplaneta americana TaxID=6978 RepID=UPI0037E8AD72
MGKQEWQDNSPLCCCEYWNINQERSHILGCCCNCEDFDESVERLVVCERVPFQRVSNVMSTLQDRLRIPWRGGAKQISLDSALPLVVQPLLAYIAAQSVWCTAVVALVLLLCMFYLYSTFVRFLPRTKFFFVWTLTSIVLLLLVFEFSVVPFLEIMPHENCILIGLVISSGICLYKVRSRAEQNFVVHSDMGEETELVCSVCRRRVPPRTFHCRICQACIVKRDHHCVWLDCCIGDKNHRLFVVGVLLSVSALVYGAFLTLTTICHPSFYFMETILLPDDCSDVYHDFTIALCFISSIYCIVMAFLLLLLLAHQCWLITLGMTGQEWRCVQGSGHVWCAGLRSERPFSHGLLHNWLEFFSCLRSPKDGLLTAA